MGNCGRTQDPKHPAASVGYAPLRGSATGLRQRCHSRLDGTELLQRGSTCTESSGLVRRCSRPPPLRRPRSRPPRCRRSLRRPRRPPRRLRSPSRHYSTVRAGSKGRAVVGAECYLAQAGYSVSKNGTFSADDAKCGGQVQRQPPHLRRRCSRQGVLDRPGRRKQPPIAAEGRPRLRGASGAARADRLGPARARTGKFDTATANAIKGLQRAKGWKQSGYLDQRVWGLLQSGRPPRSGS